MGFIDGRGNLVDEQDDSLPTWAQLNHENEQLRHQLTEARAECERLQMRLWHYEPPVGNCEHGVEDGVYCEPCNREYKRSAEAGGHDGTE